jgi:hypothetical protein
MKAIETTGLVDEKRRLRLDTPLPITGPSRVKVIILVPDTDEIQETEWLKSASTNEAFAFLKEDAENVYTKEDGKPFHE